MCWFVCRSRSTWRPTCVGLCVVVAVLGGQHSGREHQGQEAALGEPQTLLDPVQLHQAHNEAATTMHENTREDQLDEVRGRHLCCALLNCLLLLVVCTRPTGHLNASFVPSQDGRLDKFEEAANKLGDYLVQDARDDRRSRTVPENSLLPEGHACVEHLSREKERPVPDDEVRGHGEHAHQDDP
eukprot:CAMPEP_0206250528 /NCGR_PEP_ID=MMETSP0047_2-20121206/21524_1 /ASSEMBLY_ACC=CAM_ASM_000192 /TAXON_ID=195065 /ORGANISM="Chroomonas mesostigmatica_cf, Strain CCMP1168" /LENGTH=183 /DNA_ID=CAMNT_0053676391 /DNA_START=32 /DNA_END=582 /DNA_ORIENTATION=+